MIPIKTAEQINKIRRSSGILVETFLEIEKCFRTGEKLQKLSIEHAQLLNRMKCELCYTP